MCVSTVRLYLLLNFKIATIHKDQDIYDILPVKIDSKQNSKEMFNSSEIFIHIVNKRDIIPKIKADQNKLWNDFVDLRKLKSKII